MALFGSEAVDGGGYFPGHFVGEQRLFEHLAVHEVSADGVADRRGLAFSLGIMPGVKGRRMPIMYFAVWGRKSILIAM